VLAGGEEEIPELTSNIVKFCSYGHTNLTLTCANWEVTQAESIIVGYNIGESIVIALKNILKKRPLVVPVEKYEINHFSGTFNASGINIQSVFSFVFTKALVVLFPRKANILTYFTNPNFEQFHVEMRNKHYPLSNISTVDVQFFKINMEAAGLNDFWYCLESHERSFSQFKEPRYPARGRTDGDDTDWFYLIQLERSASNPWFFDCLNESNANVKLHATFLKAFDETGQLIGLRGNLFILNEDNFEPNKPDPDYKGNGTPPFVTQEVNVVSPILITVHHMYFLLDVERGGITYVANKSWKQILPNYYGEEFNCIQETTQGLDEV
jgi:hypothetical protein